MNRREFVKVLASISLLGWLVKLPSDAEYAGPGISSTDDEIIMLRSNDPELNANGFADMDTFGTFVPNDESRYIRECVTEMGRVARETLEDYVSGKEPFPTMTFANSAEAPHGYLIFYDPDSGDDANDGLTPATAVATPERVCALTKAPRGDIIWLL